MFKQEFDTTLDTDLIDLSGFTDQDRGNFASFSIKEK